MTKTDASFHIEAGPKRFSATVRDINLQQPLAKSAAQALREAWARHGVLVFPDQELDHAQLERFTLDLGDFGVDPFIEAMADHPNILVTEQTENTFEFGCY